MKCPHCLTSFHEGWSRHQISQEPATQQNRFVKWLICPECKKHVVGIDVHQPNGALVGSSIVYPKATSRPISADVPEPFSSDFKEASVVLSDSPKASAAISRRCVQHILREKAGVKKADLSKEIDEVLATKQLPSHLAEAIDSIRNIGNFAAHPLKSTNTGEVMDVEPGEAEWLLEILEGLFDFYFIQPAILKKKRDALNAKLAEAGKPAMK
jgi:hypothetical protein